MKISVVIPVYNRARLVERAVESVLGQTYPVAEVIVVDDGSNDNPAGQLERFMDDKLKVVKQPNKGVSRARNLGITESKHDWVAFLDSDDYWLPEKIERQVAFHQSNPKFLISQTDEMWIKNGKRVNPKNYHLKPEGDIFEPSLSRCLVSPSAVLIHKKVLEDVGLFDVRLPACEDYDLWLRVTRKYHVGLVPERLVVKTGGHSDQLSKRFWGLDRFRIKALEKLLNNNSLTPDQQKAVTEKLMEKLSIVINGAKKRNNAKLAQEYKSILQKYIF